LFCDTPAQERRKRRRRKHFGPIWAKELDFERGQMNKRKEKRKERKEKRKERKERRKEKEALGAQVF